MARQCGHRRRRPAFTRTAGTHRSGTGGLLFGLYEGVPKIKRGVTYGEVVPDKILIYQQPIEMVCRTPAQVRDQVRRTVLHEIGHHLGMDEEELEDSGF